MCPAISQNIDFDCMLVAGEKQRESIVRLKTTTLLFVFLLSCGLVMAQEDIVQEEEPESGAFALDLFETDDLRLLYFDPFQTYLVPHVSRNFANSHAFQQSLLNWVPYEKTTVLLKDFSDYLSTLPGAKKVQYGQNWIERLGHFTQLTRLIVLMSGALLVLTATFMVSSTIRLTVVTRHAELEILRLMGASKGYIQFPLILEGLLQGLFGSGLGLAFLYFIYTWIKTRFEGPSFLDIFRFTFMPIPIVIAILAVSIGLCSIGSIISIRKFLRI